jgi:hypothetical protein
MQALSAVSSNASTGTDYAGYGSIVTHRRCCLSIVVSKRNLDEALAINKVRGSRRNLASWSCVAGEVESPPRGHKSASDMPLKGTSGIDRWITRKEEALDASSRASELWDDRRQARRFLDRRTVSVGAG